MAASVSSGGSPAIMNDEMGSSAFWLTDVLQKEAEMSVVIGLSDLCKLTSVVSFCSCSQHSWTHTPLHWRQTQPQNFIDLAQHFALVVARPPNLLIPNQEFVCIIAASFPDLVHWESLEGNTMVQQYGCEQLVFKVAKLIRIYLAVHVPSSLGPKRDVAMNEADGQNHLQYSEPLSISHVSHPLWGRGAADSVWNSYTTVPSHPWRWQQ